MHFKGCFPHFHSSCFFRIFLSVFCSYFGDGNISVFAICSSMFKQQNLFKYNLEYNYASEKVKMLVTQSCLTLSDHMDCGPPGSSVHGILQTKILEWVAITFSKCSLSSSHKRQLETITTSSNCMFSSFASWRELHSPQTPPPVYFYCSESCVATSMT